MGYSGPVKPLTDVLILTAVILIVISVLTGWEVLAWIAMTVALGVVTARTVRSLLSYWPGKNDPEDR